MCVSLKNLFVGNTTLLVINAYFHKKKRSPLDPYIVYTNSYGKVLIIPMRWTNTIRNPCFTSWVTTVKNTFLLTQSWFLGYRVYSMVHWQLIAFQKLPTVQREFSFKAPLAFHVWDIFESMCFFPSTERELRKFQHASVSARALLSPGTRGWLMNLSSLQ